MARSSRHTRSKEYFSKDRSDLLPGRISECIQWTGSRWEGTTDPESENTLWNSSLAVCRWSTESHGARYIRATEFPRLFGERSVRQSIHQVDSGHLAESATTESLLRSRTGHGRFGSDVRGRQRGRFFLASIPSVSVSIRVRWKVRRLSFWSVMLCYCMTKNVWCWLLHVDAWESQFRFDSRKRDANVF